ncbi:DNA-directed RNA polymerase III subunit rpc8 [Diplonema papillatum]|nr:DNA-directed RNA polymerase III subunit rpc8 [Diplonema papillatum]
MFILSVLKDAVKLVPELFDKDCTSALTSSINEKYAGRVVPKVGLCICVYDVISYSDALLHPGDGASFSTVTFRMVVFRPFHGEVLKGRIVESSLEKGIRVDVGFFSDVWVPPCNLRQKAVFDTEEKLWTNELEHEDGEGDGCERNYLELDQMARVQVVSTEFDTATKSPFHENEIVLPGQKTKKAALPMHVVGSFNDYGLGPVEWWNFD